MSSTHERSDGGSDLLPALRVAVPSAVTSTARLRRMAGGHWLLASAPSISVAHAEWTHGEPTELRPGVLFTAVMVPARIVRAALGGLTPRECAPVLRGFLDGPVFYDPTAFRREGGFTAVLPASAARIWRVPSTVVHPPKALLRVPAPSACEPDGDRPWWAVPPDGAGELCTTALLASVATRGREQITGGGQW